MPGPVKTRPGREGVCFTKWYGPADRDDGQRDEDDDSVKGWQEYGMRKFQGIDKHRFPLANWPLRDRMQGTGRHRCEAPKEAWGTLASCWARRMPQVTGKSLVLLALALRWNVAAKMFFCF